MSGSDVATAFVHGLGTALPEGRLDAEATGRLVPELLGLSESEARAFRVLVRQSGVESRRSVLVDARGEIALYARGGPSPGTEARMAAWRECAPPLALAAARTALEQAGWHPKEVTDLVLVSCTGFAAPGVDLALIEGLGLAPSVERSHIGFMGCHGAINGLRVARGLCALRPQARVLLVAVELCTLHLDRSDRSGQIVASALFSDGAAAVALGHGPPMGRAPLLVRNTASLLLPHSADLMSWSVGDRGFAMELSPNVPARIEAGLGPWMRTWLAAQGLSLDQVASFAVHPGGVRVLDAVERALDLPAEALRSSRRLLRELGNLSSPTVLFLLEEALRQGQKPPYLLLAFGPGLFAELALLDSP